MRSEIIRYLVPPKEAFWQWNDAGEVVTWKDDKTIAFRQELCHVFNRLAPGGLPPMGAILLLLAATRDHWNESASEPQILVRILESAHDAASFDDALTQVLEGLHQVSSLDAVLRTSTEAREVICELVFEGDTDRTPVSVGVAVADVLERGLDEIMLDHRSSLRCGN